MSAAVGENPLAPAHPGSPSQHRSAAADSCPLCAAPLHPEQEWCLRCGAAARTRLAPAPNWKLPVTAFAVVAVLSLGVLAAALVKLAGGSGSSATTTVVRTSPAASILPSTATTVPAPSTTAPATPPGGAATGGAATGGAAGGVKATTTPRLTLPRTSVSPTRPGALGTGAGGLRTPTTSATTPTR